MLSEGTIGQSKAGKLEGIFGLGEAAYDAAQNKDVVRKFQRIAFKPVNPYVGPSASTSPTASCRTGRRRSTTPRTPCT